MDEERFRRLARLIAWGRVAIGCTAIVAPVAVSRPWIGAAADRTEARLLARTMGGRDLAIGIGTIRALGRSDAEAKNLSCADMVGGNGGRSVTTMPSAGTPEATRIDRIS